MRHWALREEEEKFASLYQEDAQLAAPTTPHHTTQGATREHIRRFRLMPPPRMTMKYRHSGHELMACARAAGQRRLPAPRFATREAPLHATRCASSWRRRVEIWTLVQPRAQRRQRPQHKSTSPCARLSRGLPPACRHANISQHIYHYRRQLSRSQKRSASRQRLSPGKRHHGHDDAGRHF